MFLMGSVAVTGSPRSSAGSAELQQRRVMSSDFVQPVVLLDLQ
jgi:hypothetical protein